MRLYLEELRSKIGLDTAAMDQRLYKLTGTKLRCRKIETGHYWAEITPERAQILADAYQTTPENICQLEEAEGKWEGRNYYGLSTQSFDSSIYDTALSDSERDIVYKYYSWTQKVIAYMQFDLYASFVQNGVISLADIEELGYIGLLRGVKALSQKKITEPEYFSDMDENRMSAYERWLLRRRIYTQVQNEIRKLMAEKRYAYTYAKRLDGGISSGADPDDDSDLYELIAQKDLSVEKRAESSCMLDMLYTHLNEAQIEICRLLIEGYDKTYLVRNKIASATDIGVITFYLQQLLRYGKIRWSESDYVSGSANVTYDMKINRWIVKMLYNGTTYSLSSYEDLNVALDLQVVANVLRATNDFVPWYERHLIYNPLVGMNTFTYPLPGDDEEYNELCNRDVRRIYTRTSDDNNAYGVHFVKRSGTYEVTYGHDKIGRAKTLEEGLALRKLAEEKDKEGVYEEWLENIRFNKHNPCRPNVSIFYEKRRNRYAVSRYYMETQNSVYIGSYPTHEEAVKIKEIANQHLAAGDFEEWLQNYKAEHGRRIIRDDGLIMSRIRQYKDGRYEVVWYNKEIHGHRRIALCDTKQEAERVMELANAHIIIGDYENWLAEFKQETVKKRASILSPAHMYREKHKDGTYYSVTWQYKFKKMTIAYLKDKNAAEEVLKLANEHVKAGDILEWIPKYKQEQKSKRSCTPARMRFSRGKYFVSRYHQGVDYYIYSSKDKSSAEQMLEIANTHIQQGDFLERLEQYKADKKAVSDSVPAEKPKVSWCYALVDFSAFEADCYKVVGYDIYESPHTIYETSDVDKAYNFMNLANEHIEAGDFDAWFDKRIN